MKQETMRFIEDLFRPVVGLVIVGMVCVMIYLIAKMAYDLDTKKLALENEKHFLSRDQYELDLCRYRGLCKESKHGIPSSN